MKKKRLKIGFISPVNPFKDRKSWSGTYYNTRLALERAGHEIFWIKYNNNGLLLKIYRKMYKYIYKSGPVDHTKLASIIKISSIKDNLDLYDVIFVPGQSEIVAGIKTKRNIIYYTDVTVPLMKDYYWFNYSQKGLKMAIDIEKKAVKNASINLYASDWARNSAIKDYGVNKIKTDVLPFGPGITFKENNISKDYRKKETINLIFSGVDWVRKGGDIAVKAVEKLNEDGYKAKLHICGVKNLDNDIVNKNFVKNLGFLDKEDTQQYQKYVEAYQKADILILPTRAECAGIVFSEASLFGVPVITTDTGGIADYVKNNINGKRLPLEADGIDYAREIEKWIDTNSLKNLSVGARKLYEEKNNWKNWGKRFNEIIEML